MHLNLQSLGKGRDLVIGDDAFAALDFRNLRLIEVDAKTCQSPGHVVLRNFGRRGQTEALDGGTGHVALLFLFRHGTLEGVPILILFGTGIILVGNKLARLRMNRPGSKPIHLLCADDHTLVGEALVKVFTTAGYQVVHVDNGRAAWEKISSEPKRYHVVITDHSMPEFDGLQLVQRLRQTNFAGRIIVYSASLTPEEDLAYRKLSVDAIVQEGPNSAKLLAVVEAFHAGGAEK